MPRGDDGLLATVARLFRPRGKTPPPPTDLGSPRPRAGSVPPPASPPLAEPANAELSAILTDLDRLAPGAVRRRALDFGCGRGEFTQALCDRFGECDGVDDAAPSLRAAREHNRHGERCRYHEVAAGVKLPFGDETFDFVRLRCTPRASGEPTDRAIGDVIRVLRLLGVAVIDLAGAGGPPLAQPGDHGERVETPSGGPLALSAPARLSIEPGGERELELTVTNAGWSTLGSGLVGLRVAGAWVDEDGSSTDGPVIELPEILVPGDSTTVRVAVRAPQRAGGHMLQLEVNAPGHRGVQRRSPPIAIAVTVGLAITADDHVAGAVRAAGGRVFEVQQNDSEVGPNPRRRYYVGRA
jgi:SAM-dependent methyltransferase